MAKFKSLNIGDTVRVVSLADTADRCGLNPNLTASVGVTFTIMDLQRHFGKGRVQLSNGWWYSPKGLEVLTPDECTAEAEPTGDEHGEFVTPSTPVGTTVVYIGGDIESSAPSGVPLKLARHDGDTRPRVDVIGSTSDADYYFPDYKYLRVHVEGTAEPVVHTKDDFRYTRVRVKETDAQGVIIGRTAGGHLVVLHDKASSEYHDGRYSGGDSTVVEGRIYYYGSTELEIIGGVQ